MIDRLRRTKHIIFNCECRHEQTAREALDEVTAAEAELASARAQLEQLREALRLAVAAAKVATDAHDAFLVGQTRGNALALRDAMEALALLAAVPAARTPEDDGE